MWPSALCRRSPTDRRSSARAGDPKSGPPASPRFRGSSGSARLWCRSRPQKVVDVRRVARVVTRIADKDVEGFGLQRQGPGQPVIVTRYAQTQIMSNPWALRQPAPPTEPCVTSSEPLVPCATVGATMVPVSSPLAPWHLFPAEIQLANRDLVRMSAETGSSPKCLG
jgi:hypothetical protein